MTIVVMVMAIWYYAAVFLLALSEAMPIVGAGSSALILGISALASRGIVELWPLLVTAILGAAPLHVSQGCSSGPFFSMTGAAAGRLAGKLCRHC
jgi:hypothetical protein